MELGTPIQPQWTHRYRAYAAWTFDELRNLVCGLPPNPASDLAIALTTAPPTRQEVADAFVRDELKRVAADRHIRDAIFARQLVVLEPVDDRLLEKLKDHLTDSEIESLRRAIVHERSCSKAYHVATEVAIRWGASHRGLFPEFPYTVADLRLPAPPITAATPDRTSRRSALVKAALRGKTKKDFCRENGLSPDILRAVIAGDPARADVEHWTPDVLKLLNISPEDWG
jgi:hypothetical protein